MDRLPGVVKVVGEWLGFGCCAGIGRPGFGGRRTAVRLYRGMREAHMGELNHEVQEEHEEIFADRINRIYKICFNTEGTGITEIW